MRSEQVATGPIGSRVWHQASSFTALPGYSDLTESAFVKLQHSNMQLRNTLFQNRQGLADGVVPYALIESITHLPESDLVWLLDTGNNSRA